MPDWSPSPFELPVPLLPSPTAPLHALGPLVLPSNSTAVHGFPGTHGTPLSQAIPKPRESSRPGLHWPPIRGGGLGCVPGNQGSKATLHQGHPRTVCLGKGAHGMDAQATWPTLQVSGRFPGAGAQPLPVNSDTNTVPGPPSVALLGRLRKAT